MATEPPRIAHHVRFASTGVAVAWKPAAASFSRPACKMVQLHSLSSWYHVAYVTAALQHLQLYLSAVHQTSSCIEKLDKVA